MTARTISFPDCARTFLEGACYGPWRIETLLPGDASSRRYARIYNEKGTKAILVFVPSAPGDAHVARPSLEETLAYAQGLAPFLLIAEALGAYGLKVPHIYEASFCPDLAILEDLGNVGYTNLEDAVLQEAWDAAVDVLVQLHVCTHDKSETSLVSHRFDQCHHLGALTRDIFLAEAQQFEDFYLPYQKTMRNFMSKNISLASFWGGVFDHLEEGVCGQKVPTCWVMRDYHSPNLMWLPHARGLKRVGVLDFQDMLIGSCVYDVVSLLQDARRDISPQMETALQRRYLDGMCAAGVFFEEGAFYEAYALWGAQRNARILGTFVRHAHNAKNIYLQHMKRVESYLMRNIEACERLEALRSIL